MIELFVNLFKGEWFSFGDNRDRKLIKSDDTHYASPTGVRQIHPYVAVIPEGHTRKLKSIFDLSDSGDSDGHNNNNS